MAHVMEDGSGKSFVYALRTLSTAESGYGHLDKEALAVVFAVKKFHQFLYRCHFKIYKDHEPLLGLHNPERATPFMTSSRMQRWALTLLTYEYELVYRPGNQNSNTNALRRQLLLDAPEVTPVPGDIVHLLSKPRMGHPCWTLPSKGSEALTTFQLTVSLPPPPTP